MIRIALKKSFLPVLLGIAALSLASCLEQNLIEDAPHVAAFGTMPGATKASLVTTMPSAFNVWGYVWPVTGSQGRPNWMCQETFTKNGQYWFSALPHGNIPQGYKVRLWAVWPLAPAGVVALPDAEDSGMPTFAYDCPSDVAGQEDLLVAWGDAYEAQPAATPLHFRHALTCVLFKTAADFSPTCTVTGISLTHAASSGTFTENDDPDADRWSGLSGDVTYSIAPNKALTSVDIDTQINADDQHMIIVPQVLPANSEVVVSYTDGAGSHTLSASLADLDLPMGYKVVVRLSFPEGGSLAVNVTVEPWIGGDEYEDYFNDDWVYGIYATSPLGFTADGGSATVTVDAYRHRGSVTESVPWVAQVETSPGVWADMTEGNRPWWLPTFPLSSRSGAAAHGEDYSLTAAALRVTTHEEMLQRNAVTGRVDLSKVDVVTGETGPRAAANTYVVRGPGQYSIPVTYGCAVDQLCYGALGVDRTQSYDPDGSYTDYLDQFRTHVRNALEYSLLGESAMRIQGPWIREQSSFGSNVTQAVVLWDRFNNGGHCVTVEGFRTEDGHSMLDFTVDAATVSPGCAVIGVKDANLNVVAWSYLIWIQPEDLSPRAVYYGEGMRYVQRYDLGWTDTSTGLHYEAATRRIRLRLTEGPEQYAYVSLSWSGRDLESTQGWAPRFQWGRKDALPPDAAVENSSQMVYWSIRNPSTFLTYGHLVLTTRYYDWSDNDYRNLWNATNTEYAKSTSCAEKTVYDPCPRGYVVAPGNTFDYLAAQPYDDLGNDTRGYASPQGVLLLHCKGYTDKDGTAVSGAKGLWWTDSPSHSSHRTSFALRVDGSTTTVDSAVEKATGASVRCVRHTLAQ